MNHSGSSFGSEFIRRTRIPRSPPDLSLTRNFRIVQEMDVDEIIPLASQVGGHAGVSTSEDGSLLIKPALTREVSFYQHLTSDPAFASLKPYIPRFYGTLRLEGKVEGGNLETLSKADFTSQGRFDQEGSVFGRRHARVATYLRS